MSDLTKDHSDTFFSCLKSISGQLRSDPMNMMMVMFSESNCRADARNPNGNASGLIQFMPSTLVGLGWRAGDAEFRKLDSTAQLPFVLKYYRPYDNHLETVAGLYVSTFLPAFVKHAAEPGFVLTFKNEGRGFYEANAGFDVNGDKGNQDTGDLKIQVHELEDYVRRSCVGPRWRELVARLTGEGVQEGDDSFDIGTIYGMQLALNAIGFDAAVDGVWGPQSKSALEKFQYDHKLKVDGVYGPISKNELQEAYQKFMSK